MKNVSSLPLIKMIFSILTIQIAQASYAAPVAIDISYFSGTETILSFDELFEDQIITNEYSGQGIDFSNSSHVSASTSSGEPYEAWFFFNNPGNAVLQNLIGPNESNPPIVIDFTQSQQLIGFDIITNPSNTEFSVTSEVTTFFIDTNLPESFVGFYDPNGISQLTITAFDFDNYAAIAMNDLRFENITTVPLPPSIILFLTGLLTIFRQQIIR